VPFPVSPLLVEVIGLVGFFVYVVNYILLSVHRIDSHDWRHFALNFLAAALVLIGLSNSFNLASALTQVFWMAISVLAMHARLRPRHGAAPTETDTALMDATAMPVAVPLQDEDPEQKPLILY